MRPAPPLLHIKPPFMHTSGNSKRIAKNTLLLYGRMALTMLVALFTSRVVLQALGVTDFGIYNVVGGVVAMMGFLNGSLGGATSRFITYELGLGGRGNVRHIFRCAVSIHYLLAALVLVVAETVGLWFVLEKLVIPDGRMTAALWAYQCSVLTVVVTIISSPYNALIIAHERMSAFAYISILEVFLKLGIVYLLMAVGIDRLILYATLLLVVQVSIRFIYSGYCSRHFPETSGRWLWDRRKSREIFSYAGWTLNGNLAVMGYTQGINILLNLFFGPAVNAARAISVQVQSAAYQFFNNFLTAVRPQITKSYAQGDLPYMHKLILSSSKYGAYLFLIIAVPLLSNTSYVLSLWLGQVPAHTVAFTQLMLLTCMNSVLKMPTLMGIHATGDIKRFQIVEGSLLLTVVPIAYAFLKWRHIQPETVFIIYLLVETVTQFARVWIVFPRIQMKRRLYFTHVLFPLIFTCLPLVAFGFTMSWFFPAHNFSSLIRNISIALPFTLLCIGFLGMHQEERKYFSSKIRSALTRLKNYRHKPN